MLLTETLTLNDIDLDLGLSAALDIGHILLRSVRECPLAPDRALEGRVTAETAEVSVVVVYNLRYVLYRPPPRSSMRLGET